MIPGRPLNRLAPQAGPEAYKTYQIRPYVRPASCGEVECARQRNGWRSVMDLSTVAGVKQANWIAQHSGRAYTHEVIGTLVTFTFAAGQTCFERHQVIADREPLARIVDGDWRGNPRGTGAQVLGTRSWIDSFGEHQLKIAEAHKRG